MHSNLFLWVHSHLHTVVFEATVLDIHYNFWIDFSLDKIHYKQWRRFQCGFSFVNSKLYLLWSLLLLTLEEASFIFVEIAYKSRK